MLLGKIIRDLFLLLPVELEHILVAGVGRVGGGWASIDCHPS